MNEEQNAGISRDETGSGSKKNRFLALIASPEFALFHGVFRIAFYLLIAGSVFFAAALLVLSLRQHKAKTFTMKDLRGRFYIDIHNDLSASQLRVSLIHRSYADSPSGIVLYQSIQAGATIQARDKVYLIVNRSNPLFRMPSLNGITLLQARSTLSRFTYKSRVYAVDIGAISYVASDSPAEIILAQYPPAGTKISRNEKAYFLVSSGKESVQNAKKNASIEELKKQNPTILMEYFNRRGQEYRLSLQSSSRGAEDNGRILKLEKDGQGVYQIDAVFNETDSRYRGSYEKFEASVKKDAKQPAPCRIVLTEKTREQRGAGEDRDIFISKHSMPGETIQMLFFRQGQARVDMFCGNELIASRFYRPEIVSPSIMERMF